MSRESNSAGAGKVGFMDAIPILTVLRPGLMSTIQDLGRSGWRGIAVSTGGSMDFVSLRMANALVGNRPNAAALEITLLGPTLRAEADIVAAIVGADIAGFIDDQPIAPGAVFTMRARQTLSFGRPVTGVRSYLAVAGGFEVPLALGSRSTFIRAGFGGVEGRAIRPGDVLLGRAAIQADYRRLGWSAAHGANVGTEPPIRVLEGPHADLFEIDALGHFLASAYTVSHESDRMGVRLNGPSIGVLAGAEMVSEPVTLGAIQVPPNGMPIVLMADQQTTGGYPLVAIVIAADIPALAQRAPGSIVRFEAQ